MQIDVHSKAKKMGMEKKFFNVFELRHDFWPNELSIFRDDFESKSSYLFATPHGPLGMFL